MIWERRARESNASNCSCGFGSQQTTERQKEKKEGRARVLLSVPENLNVSANLPPPSCTVAHVQRGPPKRGRMLLIAYVATWPKG